MKVLITPTSLKIGNNPKVDEALQSLNADLLFNDLGRPMQEDELISRLEGCQGYIAGLDCISKRVMEKCCDLRVISRYGSGVDSVDLEEAKKRGITITNTPGVNAEAVGELAFGLILALVRKIAMTDKEIKNGKWPRMTGIELKGKTLGILGFGAIGKVVARCAKGFGMDMAVYDPYVTDSSYFGEHITKMEFNQVLRTSDIISIHMPLTKQTQHMISIKEINLMKSGVYLINTSRGGILDEEAVYAAALSGKIAGVGLDAFEQEPPNNNKLVQLNEVICTPHAGAHTKEASEVMALLSIRNLKTELEGNISEYRIL